jgi:hypothetical protein
MFIKRLTAEEIAQVLGDPATMPPGAADGRAYYVRAYGETGVILSQIVIDADMSKLRPGDLPPHPNRPEHLNKLFGE